MGLARGWHFLLVVFLIAILSSVSSGLGAGATTADQPTILGVRAAVHDATTRFVLDLSKKVAYSVESRGDGQIVLDFPDVDWRASSSSLHRPVGLLKNFQFARVGPGKTRLVLQTKGGTVATKTFLIPPVGVPNYRLVVDLGKESARPDDGPTRSASHAAHGKSSGKQALALPPAPEKQPEPLPVVVIDPGHGGIDPGAISLTGAYEKTIVLSLAREVKARLEEDGKVKCVLTRNDDVFIPLRERVSIARADHADLFMSLHADTVDNPAIRGLSVYTLSQTASDSEAQALADKENKADIVAGIDFSNELPEVTNILIDLVQRESMNLSARFAARVIHEVKHDTHNVLESNTHRFAGFAVLKAPDVPSVLIETGYLSNTEDEQLLRRPEYRAKLAAALARAIEEFFTDTRKGRRT